MSKVTLDTFLFYTKVFTSIPVITIAFSLCLRVLFVLWKYWCFMAQIVPDLVIRKILQFGSWAFWICCILLPSSLFLLTSSFSCPSNSFPFFFLIMILLSGSRRCSRHPELSITILESITSVRSPGPFSWTMVFRNQCKVLTLDEASWGTHVNSFLYFTILSA